jgi:glutaredoxin
VVFATLVCLTFVEQTSGLPFSMPRSWYTNRPLWYFTMLGSLLTGWMLLRHGDTNADDDSTDARGGRFRRVVVYTRANCHLCDDAVSVLKRYSAELPRIETVDVDSDPTLGQQFGDCVPVVEIDGKVRFRGRVNPVLLQRLIHHAKHTGETPSDAQQPDRTGT